MAEQDDDDLPEVDDTPIGMLPSGELATVDDDDDDEQELDELDALLEEFEEESEAAAHDERIAEETLLRAQAKERHDLAIEMGRKAIASGTVDSTVVQAFDRLSSYIDESNRIARAPRKLVRDENNRPASSVVDLGDGK